jgi:hypothetical protein
MTSIILLVFSIIKFQIGQLHILEHSHILMMERLIRQRLYSLQVGELFMSSFNHCWDNNGRLTLI